jgi:hypothetical protein
MNKVHIASMKLTYDGLRKKGFYYLPEFGNYVRFDIERFRAQLHYKHGLFFYCHKKYFDLVVSILRENGFQCIRSTSAPNDDQCLVAASLDPPKLMRNRPVLKDW